MESKAKLLGHPIHPMLIVFPLGLLATAVAFDIVALSTSDGSWFRISFWMIAAGIIGGLLSAVFGLVDWIAIPPAAIEDTAERKRTSPCRLIAPLVSRRARRRHLVEGAPK